MHVMFACGNLFSKNSLTWEFIFEKASPFEISENKNLSKITSYTVYSIFKSHARNSEYGLCVIFTCVVKAIQLVCYKWITIHRLNEIVLLNIMVTNIIMYKFSKFTYKAKDLFCPLCGIVRLGTS